MRATIKSKILQCSMLVAYSVAISCPVSAQDDQTGQAQPAQPTKSAKDKAARTKVKRQEGAGYYGTLNSAAPSSGSEGTKSNGYYATVNQSAPPGKEATANGYYSIVPAVKDAPVQPGNEEDRAANALPAPAVDNKVVPANVSPAPDATPLVPPPAANNPAVAPPLPAAPADVAKPTMASAVSAFNNRDYHSALMQFQKLDHSGMCNDKVHYYIARCFQQMSQVQAAQQNYEYVMYRSKDPTLRAYAEVAYAQLSKYASHRSYEGHGNNFQGFRGGGGRGGGGGG